MELQRFWRDLTALWEGEGGAPLFLGAIVLHKTQDGGSFKLTKYDIIDGQQRLLTLYITLMAIAEGFQISGVKEKSEDMTRDYLLLQNSENKDHPQIQPAVHDTKQFNDMLSVLKHPHPRPWGPDIGDEHGLLLETWRWIRLKVREFAFDQEHENGYSPERLQDLLGKLVDHTHLVVIEVLDKVTAHQVFERLNKGGKPLDDIDLVRNAVFSNLASNDPSSAKNFYNTRWNQFEKKLGDKHKDYWYPLALVRCERATKTGAYSALQMRWQDECFTKGDTGSALADRIMADLQGYVVPFQAIAGIGIPKHIGADAARALRRLHRAKVPTMTYSFFFEAVKALIEGRLAEERFVLFCEIAEAAVARRVLEGREMTAFQQAFKDLWRDDLPEKDLLDHLKGKLKLPTDDELRQGILTQSLYKMSRCRYVLTEYERWQDDGKQLEPTDTDEFHVDHVLPQKYQSKDWPGISREEYQSLRHTWGNLALLPPKMNWSKSAAEYQQARPQLIKPGGVPFRSTGMLVSEYETWSAKTIRERSAQLAEWAIHRWPSTIEGYRDKDRAKRLAKAN